MEEGEVRAGSGSGERRAESRERRAESAGERKRGAERLRAKDMMW